MGFNREFSDGLLDQLAKHIGDFYHREIPEQNGGLAVVYPSLALVSP